MRQASLMDTYNSTYKLKTISCNKPLSVFLDRAQAIVQ